jgi:nicotinamidase-related amidase
VTSTALLVMDAQQGIVDHSVDDRGYLPRLAAAVEAARGAGDQVIGIEAWRSGLPAGAHTPLHLHGNVGAGR